MFLDQVGKRRGRPLTLNNQRLKSKVKPSSQQPSFKPSGKPKHKKSVSRKLNMFHHGDAVGEGHPTIAPYQESHQIKNEVYSPKQK